MYDWLGNGLNKAGPSVTLPKRMLGRTGVPVTRLGLGGQGYLELGKNDVIAVSLVQKAVDLGVTYIDTAPAYGPSQRRIGWALRGLADPPIFLATKTSERTYDGAMQQLEESLRSLGRHINLWQLHNLTWRDTNFHDLESGVIAAMREAKQKGTVDHVGFTGHSDPVLMRVFIKSFPDFETCLFPLNIADVHGPSFKHVLLPELSNLGIGAIAMKVMARGAFLDKLPYLADRAAQIAFNYVLSHNVDCAIIGIDNESQLVNLANWVSEVAYDDNMLKDIELLSARARVEGNWFKVCFEGSDIPKRFERKEPME